MVKNTQAIKNRDLQFQVLGKVAGGSEGNIVTQKQELHNHEIQSLF